MDWTTISFSWLTKLFPRKPAVPTGARSQQATSGRDTIQAQGDVTIVNRGGRDDIEVITPSLDDLYAEGTKLLNQVQLQIRTLEELERWVPEHDRWTDDLVSEVGKVSRGTAIRLRTLKRFRLIQAPVKYQVLGSYRKSWWCESNFRDFCD